MPVERSHIKRAQCVLAGVMTGVVLYRSSACSSAMLPGSCNRG